MLLKPSGMTSHDVVDFVRKKLKIQRVGHTGTLDPLAAGLMLLCLGRATRLSEFLSNLDKIYRFEIVFGFKTETQDAEGRIVEIGSTDSVNAEKLERVLDKFVGEIEQIPPMLSAVHYQGKRLYELARKGIQVERAPRKVQIYRLTLLNWWDKPVKRALIEVHCSRGTYIRALASDIGDELGCGAYQHFLVRMQIGPFKSEQGLTLEEFDKSVLQGKWMQNLLPLDKALPMFPELVLTKIEAKRILNGMESVVGTIWGYPNLKEEGLVRLYDQDDRFLGVGMIIRRGNFWVCQPQKIFPPSS